MTPEAVRLVEAADLAIAYGNAQNWTADLAGVLQNLKDSTAAVRAGASLDDASPISFSTYRNDLQSWTYAVNNYPASPKTTTPQTPVLSGNGNGATTPPATTPPTTTPPATTTFQGLTSLPVVGPIVVQIGNAAVGLPVVGGFINSIAAATGAHPGTVVIGTAALLYFVVLPMVMNQGRRGR